MEFLVGDDTGLLKSVSTASKCTSTYRAGQQDRKEAICTACWSQLDSNGHPLEVTVGRRSGLIEALGLPVPPSTVLAELRKRAKKASEKHGQGSLQETSHYSALPALSQSVRPRRALRIPSACVQVSNLHKPDARSLLSASLTDFLLTDPYFCRFNCPQSSPLLPSSSPYLPCCSGSSYSQIFCLGEEGHACVVDWEDDFLEGVCLAARSLETNGPDQDAETVVSRGEEVDEEEEVDGDVSPERTRGFSLFEIDFPQVHAFQHPAAPSVSGILRSVSSTASAKRKRMSPGSCSPTSTSSIPHVRGAWQLSAPVHCSTPVNPLMPDRFAFGGKGNGVKVFDLSQGRYVWASKNVKQTLLQLQVSVHPTSLAWLSSMHPLMLAAGTARGSVRLYDLRCQRRPVYEVANATRGSFESKENRVISAMVGEEVQLHGPRGLWNLVKRVCENAQTDTSNGGIPDPFLQSGNQTKPEKELQPKGQGLADEQRRLSGNDPGTEAVAAECTEKRIVTKKRKNSHKTRTVEAEAESSRSDGERAKCQVIQVQRERSEDKACSKEELDAISQPRVKREADGEQKGDSSESAVSRWTAHAKAGVRTMYGQTKAKLYFADSLGAVYVHAVLTEDALLRHINKDIKKHNRTSCCTTLSEEEDLEAETGKGPARNSSGRVSAHQSGHTDTKTKNRILLAFREKEEAPLSSKKNSSKRCTSPLNGPQYGCFFVGGFKGAMGAIVACGRFTVIAALAADVSRQYVVGVGYGRHAYIWQAVSRRLVAKVRFHLLQLLHGLVYLKQKLLAVLPGTQLAAEYPREEPRGKQGSRSEEDDSGDSEESTGEEDSQSSLGSLSEGGNDDESREGEE
ncbi:hypothetical protein CSUI_007723 [Cystoisospora suis]|uniref:Uncharacterized protein n=1 Tax=Cystoisospora suis TaxID=483139 RepID=A0A2C6KLM6_9APIC|nr:hypothetical protein CSUI_007723 [Cystoisospora suis]